MATDWNAIYEATVAKQAGKPALPKAKGRQRHVSGQMNQTEKAHAENLDKRILAGEVSAYWFEQVTFKIAEDCRYTPDFMVMLASGEIEIHETKGHWEDDALVKIKVAAALLPFQFIAYRKLPKKEGGGWEQRKF